MKKRLVLSDIEAPFKNKNSTISILRDSYAISRADFSSFLKQYF